MVTRREFLGTLTVGAAGIAVGTTAKSYSQILGSNHRLNFAVIGLNGRGYAHLASLKANRSAARITHVCDVDGNILKKFADRAQQEFGEAPVLEKDFRRTLEEKNVDAITIATPDHLACAYGHRRIACGQACLCGEAVQPQSCRGRDARASAAEVWQARADRNATALFTPYHRNHHKNS